MRRVVVVLAIATLLSGAWTVIGSSPSTAYSLSSQHHQSASSPRFALNCGTGLTAYLVPFVLRDAKGNVINPKTINFTSACQLHDKCWTKLWHVGQGNCDRVFYLNMEAECARLTTALLKADCNFLAVKYHNALAGSLGEKWYQSSQRHLAFLTLFGVYFGHGTITTTGSTGTVDAGASPRNTVWQLPDGQVTVFNGSEKGLVINFYTGSVSQIVHENGIIGYPGAVVTWEYSWSGGGFATVKGTFGGQGADPQSGTDTYSGTVTGTKKVHLN